MRKALLIGSIIGFLLTFLIIGYLRFVTVDETTSNNQGEELYISDTSNSSSHEDVTNKALALFLMIAPFVTSIASGFCSFLLAGNPLEKEITANEEYRGTLNNVAKEITAYIKQAENDPTKEKLLENDEDRYKIARAEAIALAKELTDYFRNCLMTLVRDPSAISRLSDESASDLVQLMDNNKQINLMIDQMEKENSGAD